MKVREWFSDEKKWCKGTVARDSKGDPTLCDLRNPDLCSMCIYGAVFALYKDVDTQLKIYERIRAFVFHESIGQWNDTTTFQGLLAVVTQLEI